MHTCILVADNGDIYDVLYPWSDYDNDPNARQPHAKFDWFGIGGRYAGALPLKQPRMLSKFFGLLPPGESRRVSVAKKSEIDLQVFLAEPPAALFFRGSLYESPLFAQGEALEKWQAEFRDRFAQIPDDITLQIVDAHS
jgi:hypothetical protein